MEEQVAVGVLDAHRERRRARRGPGGGAAAGRQRPGRRSVRRAPGSAGARRRPAAIVTLELIGRRGSPTTADLAPAVARRRVTPLRSRMSRRAGHLAAGRAAAAASAISSIATANGSTGAAVEAVVAEVEVAGEVERRARARRRRRRPCAAARAACASSGQRRRGARDPAAADHDLGLALAPAAQLLVEQPAAGLDGDQRHAALGELALRPRARPCRPSARGPSRSRPRGAGQRAVELLGELVEHLAGGGVVGLAAVAEAARDGAEEDEEAQRLGAQPRGERARRARLGARRRARASRRPCRAPAGPR